MRNVFHIYRANQDIQFITDPYACAVYIVAYMSKTQRGMSLLLNQACNEARKGNTNLREQVRAIGNKFLNAVEVSAQEAVYLILQMPITKASRSVDFIPTSPPEDRLFLLKKKETLENMNPSDTNIEAGNAIKQYASRPKQLEQWCLADYMSKLVVKYPKKHTDQYDTDNEDDPESNDECNIESITTSEAIEITLKSGVVIQSCRVPKVIRFVNYNVKSDPENFAREHLMLYTPRRKEKEDLLGPYDTYQPNFQDHKQQIMKGMKTYEPNKDVMDLTNHLLLSQIENVDVTVAPNAPSQQQDEDDILDSEENNPNSEDYAFFSPPPQHARYDIANDIGLPAPAIVSVNTLPSREPDDTFFIL